MSRPELEVCRRGALTTLTLHRSHAGNALLSRVVTDFDHALDQAGNDGTQLVVIAGADTDSCSGLDLSVVGAGEESLPARILSVELLLQRLQSAPYGTLALAKGRMAGFGADLFAACAHRWIVDDATFAIGGGPDVVLGIARFTALVGGALTREWAVTGAVVDAERALASGLATARISSAKVPQATAELLKELDRMAHRTKEANIAYALRSL